MTKFALLLVCIGLVSCTKSHNDLRQTPEQAMANQQTTELRLELVRVASSSIEVNLKLVNRGHQPITIDRRLLNPIILTQLTDGSNRPVGKVPPSVARAAEKSDMLILQPGQAFELSFAVTEITMEDLNT